MQWIALLIYISSIEEPLVSYSDRSSTSVKFCLSCVIYTSCCIILSLLQKRKIVISVNSKRLEFYSYSEEWCRVLSRMIKSARNMYTGVDNGTNTFHSNELEITSKFLSVVRLTRLLSLRLTRSWATWIYVMFRGV